MDFHYYDVPVEGVVLCVLCMSMDVCVYVCVMLCFVVLNVHGLEDCIRNGRRSLPRDNIRM